MLYQINYTFKARPSSKVLEKYFATEHEIKMYASSKK